MRTLKAIWMPTWRCNLACTYCGARQYPHGNHAQPELTPEEWIEAFNSWPERWGQVSVTGGEYSVYKGFADVLSATDFPFTLDTNLRTDATKYLRPEWLDRLMGVYTSLQFDPEHELGRAYFAHLRALRASLPDRVDVNCRYMPLWRDLPERVEIVKQRVAEIRRVWLSIGCFDHSFLFKGILPEQEGRCPSCSGGHDFVVLCPDGAAFRCLGHLYAEYEYLGNVREGLAAILHSAPQPCERLICTACDNVTKADIETPEG